VRVFKNTWFARFADKEDIKNDDLRVAAKQLDNLIKNGQLIEL